MTAATLEQARAAKQKLRAQLGALAELRGVGIAVLDGGGFGVKVNLTRRPADGLVPDDVDGVPVVIDIVGPIEGL